MRLVRSISRIGFVGLVVGAAIAVVAAVRRRARVPAAPDRPAQDESLRADLDEAEIVSIDEVEVLVRDSGELYGVATSRAADRVLPEDDVAARDGATWLEALETSAIENGAEPGRELGLLDEDDLAASRPNDSRDIPVADRGAGGPSGV